MSEPEHFPLETLLAEAGMIITAGGPTESDEIPAELTALAEQVGHEVAGRLRTDPIWALLVHAGTASLRSQYLEAATQIASVIALRDLSGKASSDAPSKPVALG